MTRYSLKGMGLADREIDPKAWTAQELADAKGIGYTTAVRHARANVLSGRWEQVWRKSRNGLWTKAYRPKGGRR